LVPAEAQQRTGLPDGGEVALAGPERLIEDADGILEQLPGGLRLAVDELAVPRLTDGNCAAEALSERHVGVRLERLELPELGVLPFALRHAGGGVAQSAPGPVQLVVRRVRRIGVHPDGELVPTVRGGARRER